MGEEGASVGEEVLLEGGIDAGSRSLSGIGGDINGRCVIRSSTRRKIALRHDAKFCRPSREREEIHFIVSKAMMPLHLIFEDTFLRKPISISNWVKRMNSSVRAAHLYNVLFSVQALV